MSDWLLPGAARDHQAVTADWMPVGVDLIEGVAVRESKTVTRGTGLLTECWRRDWQLDDQPVEQVFQNVVEPGGVSAWHAHEDATDRIMVVAGQLTLVLYDSRVDASTFGRVNEFNLSIARPTVVSVPRHVWHGVVNRTSSPAALINMPDVAYSYESPDHWRLPWDTPEIPYRINPSANPQTD